MQKAIDKPEFQDWKQNSVTQAVFGAIKERQQNLKELLCASAGMDPGEDRKLTGMIAAYNTLLLIDFSDVNEDE